MKYIQKYNTFEENQNEEMNEGLRNWVATFLMLANLGMVPPFVSSASAKEKQEFVENQPQDKIDAALFAKFMTDNSLSDFNKAYSQFIKVNPSVKTSLDSMQKHITKSGKQVLFGKKFIKHDYSNVDIHNFTPDNWLTDIGDFIPDEDEPAINNWISDYEKKTSVEIGIITLKNLNDEDIFDYSQQQFRRLGIGKKYADDGILLVFSMEDRKWRIHTGYGVEGSLPDAICARIGRNYIAPHFKEGDYEGGIMAALEQIRENIGEEAYELKKQAERERDEHNKMAFQDTMTDVLGFLAIAGIIGAIIGGIVYVNKKAKKAKEEREKALASLDKMISEVDKLVKSFPKSIDTNSNELKNAFNKAKQAVSTVSLLDISGKDKMKKEDLDKLVNANKQLYSSLNSVIDSYRSIKSNIEKKQRDIESMSGIRLGAYSAIETALIAASEIQKLGYQSGQVPNKSEVDELDTLYNRIESTLSSDFDKASLLFGAYRQNIGEITSRAGNVKTTLSSIRSSINRVQNWEKEISSIKRSFDSVANSSEKSKVASAIEEFKSLISRTKDYVSLESNLDSVIRLMKKAIERDEEEKRKKREEEERERRRKREEEEEEERRRSSYYSSSSSSSWSSSSDSGSSFGGFGGGDSGGGGASGSW